MPWSKVVRLFDDETLSAEPDPWKVNPPLTLAEARRTDDAYVVLWGGYGGTNYLIASASEVLCSQEELGSLLFELDRISWDNFQNAGIEYVRKMDAESRIKPHRKALDGLTAWLSESLVEL